MENTKCKLQTLLFQQAPEAFKKHISNISLKVSSNSSSVIRELATTAKSMKKSSNMHCVVGEMNSAVEELRANLKSLPSLFNPPSMSEVEIHENKKIEPASRTMETMPDLLEIIPLVTSASLLIEIATRVNGIVDAVEELADLAEFETASNEKSTKNELSNHFLPDQQKDNETTKDFQPV